MRTKELIEKVRERNQRYYRLNREKCKASSRRYRELNREAIQKQRKAFREANPLTREQSQRKSMLQKLRGYGLTELDFAGRMSEQGGLCKCCRAAVATHIDHDHETGKVRGILCHCCNTGLGLFRDCPVRLEMALDYLKKYGK